MEHEGKVYARVSDIIRPFVDFSGIPEGILNRKKIIGTNVHKAIKQEIDGEFIAPPPEEQGYIKSFNKWRDRRTPTFLESEVRYYCDKKRITGMVDALVKLEGEEKAVLVDWKTSAQESPITWPMQGHLYHYLLTEAGREISPRILFLKLDQDGGWPQAFIYKLNDNTMARCMEAIDRFWATTKESDVDNKDEMIA